MISSIGWPVGADGVVVGHDQSPSRGRRSVPEAPFRTDRCPSGDEFHENVHDALRRRVRIDHERTVVTPGTTAVVRRRDWGEWTAIDAAPISNGTVTIPHEYVTDTVEGP